METRGGTLHGQKAAIKAAGTSAHVLSQGVTIDAPETIAASGAQQVYMTGRRVDN